MTINDRLFNLINIQNVKQKDLAEYIQVKGNTISEWKKRGTLPPADKIILICDFFGVDLYWFLTGEGTMQNESMTPFPNTVSPLTPNQTELLRHFDKLSEEDQLKLIGRIEYMAEIQEQTNKKTVPKSSTYDNTDSEITASLA